MKAVITGISGLRNRGVEALVATTIEQLRQRQPNIDINILTDTIDYDEIRLQPYNINLTSDDYFLLQSSRTNRLRTKFANLYKPLSPTYKNIARLLNDASIVIASGGDVFSSDYSINSLKKHLYTLEFALDAGVPVAFLAQSIGPFKTDKEAEMWLRVARRSNLITIRENLSYKYVTKDLGLSTELVKHTADAAFLLQPAPPEIVENLFKSYGITKDRPVVALGVSQGICRFTRTNYDKHVKVWFETIKMILNEFGAEVLIVPHVQDHRVVNDDRILGGQLVRLFNFDPRVHFAGADHSASEFKGLIGACDLVIAERMHAAIAGLSSGVCTLPIGYSVKAEGIMTDLFSPELVQDGLLISLEQFLETDNARKAISFAWKQRHAVSEQLKKILPEVKQKTASNFDMLLQIVG